MHASQPLQDKSGCGLQSTPEVMESGSFLGRVERGVIRRHDLEVAARDCVAQRSLLLLAPDGGAHHILRRHLANENGFSVHEFLGAWKIQQAPVAEAAHR